MKLNLEISQELNNSVNSSNFDNFRSSISNSPNDTFWLFSKQASIKPTSSLEKSYAANLPLKRKSEYLLTRGYARDYLSSLFGVNPLEVTLFAPPEKPPVLADGWGYLSI